MIKVFIGDGIVQEKQYLDIVEALTYDKSRLLAKEKTLSRHEKIGFPDKYREGYADYILEDICSESKLSNLKSLGKVVVDIGCGCDDVVNKIIGIAKQNRHELYLLDAPEMLDLIDGDGNIHKIPGKFPDEDSEFIKANIGRADIVLIYSVMMYVCVQDSIFNFLDKAVSLLALGGRLLIGDIPNRSKRRRFFASTEVIKTHQDYTGTDEIPVISTWNLDYAQIDDSIVFAIMQRYRAAGYETYLLPQNKNLPMANRREDIVIERRI